MGKSLIAVIFDTFIWWKLHDFRKFQDIDEENGKLSVRLDQLQKAFDSTKSDANLLSETVSKLETEKAESTAKLICVQSENDRMKEELNHLKVLIIITSTLTGRE